jgi:type VI secretion system secreted protein VgrG
MRSGRDYARDVARNESAHVKELSETTIGTTSRTMAGGEMLIESTKAITIKVGASKITIDQGGIWIDAPTINLNSGGAPDHDVPAVTEAGKAAAAGAVAAQAPGAGQPLSGSGPGAVNGNAGKAGVGGVAGPSGSGAGNGDAPKPVTAMGIDKKFGADTATLAAKSPSLSKDLTALEKDGWTTKYGPAGGGTSANRATKQILIDQNKAANPQAIVQSLAHEAGHARYAGGVDMSSRAKFVDSTLADEGAATLSNIRARREILAAGGKDIGIAGNPANQPTYNKAFDAFLKDGDAAKARSTIGSIYGAGERTSTTKQPYADYYGGWYDKAFPPKK